MRVRRASSVWDRFYRRHEAPWRGERPIADILPWLGPGLVLELGCGNGKTLKPLLAAGIDAVGIDLSWNILSRMPNRRALFLGDAADLPFADATFAAVLDIHCTGHLLGRGRRRAAEEAWRVLTPGGALIVERLGPGDLRASQGVAVEGEAGVRAVADGRTTHFADAARLRAEFEPAGFAVLAEDVDGRDILHRGQAVRRESVRVVFEKTARVRARTPTFRLD
jgi:SAM-dependent methyltransferase